MSISQALDELWLNWTLAGRYPASAARTFDVLASNEGNWLWGSENLGKLLTITIDDESAHWIFLYYFYSWKVQVTRNIMQLLLHWVLFLFLKLIEDSM